MKCEGHRFLERGDDGLWHEVIGNGARKKASQALRERVRRARRPAPPSGGEGIPQTASKAGSGEATAEQHVENALRAAVTGNVIGV